MFTVNRNPDAAELRKFGLVMLVGFCGLAAVVVVGMFLRGVTLPRVVLATGLALAGVCLGVVSWTSPPLARPVYVGWMTVVTRIGRVVSTVLLSVLFFALLPVFSLVVRAGDPLRKRLSRDRTYWEDYRPHQPTLERMRRPF